MLNLASAGKGEDSFGEALSAAGLVSKADFAPLNDGPLGRIFGWLDAEKGEVNIPVREETSDPRPDIFIRTVPGALAGAFHAAHDQSGRLPQLFTGANGAFECMLVAFGQRKNVPLPFIIDK